MILSEAKTALAEKLNIDYTKIAQNALFSDADLGDLLQTAAQEAWAYKPWTFTIESLKTTVAAADLTSGYLDYPNTFEDESIFLLTVNEEEWDPKNFMDYKRYFVDNPDAEDKFWATFKRLYFANANALVAGDEIAVYGKLRCPAYTSANDKLPFSPENDNDETSGNKAIVILAYADALASEKKRNPGQAEIERKKAFGMLDTLWKPMPERTAKDQRVDRPFFDAPDFFRGGGRSTTIGNFDFE